MRRKAEELRDTLEEFVSQVEFPMLVVGCLAEELVYLLTFIQGIDQSHPEAYVIVFSGDFTTPQAYIDSAVELLKLQLAGAEPVRIERGDPPFPPLPPEVEDPRLPPEQRLQRILIYLGDLVPKNSEHYVVVGLLPLKCTDFPAYTRLVGTITPVPEPAPWMAPLRIIVYDDRSQPLLKPVMERAEVDKVLYYEIDFSTPAITNALSVDAADPTLPLAERMACLHQLAAIDYAYRRYPDAIQKYGVLNEYYASVGQPMMQANCVNGAADALRAGGQLQGAKELLQRGIALGMQAQSLPALVNLLISMTDLCLQLQQYPEAESYADSGARAAAGALNPTVYADMFEKKGDAQVAQNKVEEAIASYKRCEELCKLYEYFHRWKSVLGRQAALYRHVGMYRELRAAEDELAFVEELERRGGKAGIEAQANKGSAPGAVS